MNQFVKKTTAIAALLIGSCLGASAVPPPGPDAPAPNWLRHDNLTTLSVEEAKAIMEREGRVLSLDGLQELSPDAAKVLAGFKEEELDLMGLKTLPAETAKALAGCKCDLGLEGLLLPFRGAQDTGQVVIREWQWDWVGMGGDLLRLGWVPIVAAKAPFPPHRGSVTVGQMSDMDRLGTYSDRQWNCHSCGTPARRSGLGLSIIW